jgi:RND family efflux transporter MFP subunit
VARTTNHRSRGPRLRRRLAGGCVGVAAVIAGVSLYSATSYGSPGYRTATVTKSTVTKTLDVTGTLQPVTQAAASFQVAGTVSSVAVSTGQHVNAGQILASLDPTTLQAAVTASQTSLAADQAKLSEDEAGQASTVTSAATPTGVITLTAAFTSGSSALKAAQQAVVTAQQTADRDSQTAAADLAAAETTCAATGTSNSGGGSPTTTSATSTPGTTTPTSTSTTTTPGTGGGTSPSAACTTALNTAMNAQSQVSTDQKAVSVAETALAKLLASAATSVPNPTSTPGSTGKSGSGSSGSSSTGTSRSSGGSGTSSGAGTSVGGAKPSSTSGAGVSAGSGSGQTVTNSAAQLALDQAAIDSASAVLVQDQWALADARLTSPIAGTVASVGVSAGQSVGAGSTTNTITVINAGGYQTSSSLTSTQASQVSVGDQAQVSVYGTSGSIPGTVSRVGPVSVSSSSDTYPVVVALNIPGSSMAAGSAAAVAIDVAKATDVLVVPTSAVHTTSPGRSYVVVLQAGKEKQTQVSVGVVGDIYTQISSGLSQGETVVLADPSQAVPSSSTNSTNRAFGGAGGFPGGGFPGGATRTGGATAPGG